MKILYILEQFYLHGGIEKITAQKANWLVNHQYDVTIIVTNQNNQPLIYSLDQRVKFIDLKINYTKSKSYFHPNNIIKAPKHIIKLRKTLKKVKPDIIITTSSQFDYYLLPFITSSSTIKEFHSSRYFYDYDRRNTNSAFNKIKFKVRDFIEKQYTYNVVLTLDEKKHYKSNNIIVIPNGIDIKKHAKSTLNQKIAIAAGRIAAVKSFDRLIMVWHIVAKKHPDWKLHIYGDGDIQLIDDLQRLIQKYKLTEQVCLCGATNELTEKMQNAGLYVMSSITECFPMVLLEAQTIGLPIVSFNCPYGPRNIINNQIDGVLAENNNIDKLAEAIITLIEDKKSMNEMGEKATRNVRKYSFDKIMEKWIDLLNQCNHN